MKKMTIGVLLLALLFSLTTDAAAQSDYAAMIMELKGGQAKYAEGPLEGKALEVMEFLYPMDRIAVSSGGVMVLNYFETSRREEIKGPVVVEVTVEGSQVVKGKGAVKGNAVEYLPPKSDVAAVYAQNFGSVAFRGVSPTKSRQGAQVVAVLTPMETSLPAGKPISLSWKPVKGATEYVIILHQDRQKAIQRYKTTQTAYAIPAKILKPDLSYQWQLQAMDTQGVLAQNVGHVTILSAAATNRLAQDLKKLETQLQPNSTERLAALNLLYQRYGMKAEAAKVLLELNKRLPDNTFVINQLKSLNPNLAAN